MAHLLSYTDDVNLRTKFLILVLIGLTAFVAAFYGLANMTIDKTYARADSQDVQRQVIRAHWYLSSALDTLGRTCSD